MGFQWEFDLKRAVLLWSTSFFRTQPSSNLPPRWNWFFFSVGDPLVGANRPQLEVWLGLEMEWCFQWPHMSWLVTGMDKTIEFTKLGIYVVQSGVSQILFEILGVGTIRPKWRLDLRWCSDFFLSMPLMFAVPSFHLKEKLVSSAQRVSLIIGMCTTTCGIAGKPPVRQNWTKGSSFFISVNGW